MSRFINGHVPGCFQTTILGVVSSVSEQFEEKKGVDPLVEKICAMLARQKWLPKTTVESGGMSMTSIR